MPMIGNFFFTPVSKKMSSNFQTVHLVVVSENILACSEDNESLMYNTVNFRLQSLSAHLNQRTYQHQLVKSHSGNKLYYFGKYNCCTEESSNIIGKYICT